MRNIDESFFARIFLRHSGGRQEDGRFSKDLDFVGSDEGPTMLIVNPPWTVAA